MVKDVRYRPTKYTKKVISIELYQKWKKLYPEYSKYSFLEFKRFWLSLASKYKETICSNTHGIRLPFYMGDISLKYIVTSKLNRNYKFAKEVNVEVGYMNFATNGKQGKIVWSVDYARKFNAELPLIGFQGCRDLTTRAGKAFVENPELFRITKTSKRNIGAILVKNHPNYFKEKEN